MPIAGSASADIDAPLDTVWSIVEDVETWGDWQGKIGAVEVHERDAEGRVTRCRVAIDAGIQQIKLQLDVAHEPPARRLSWTRASGDLKAMQGAWELADLGDGRTRATYMLEVEPGGILGLFITGQVEERLREMLVDARPSELKARAEAS
jgi:ribosome-associated toxin RatA of RatAB toxin-antitoxin module